MGHMWPKCCGSTLTLPTLQILQIQMSSHRAYKTYFAHLLGNSSLVKALEEEEEGVVNLRKLVRRQGVPLKTKKVVFIFG